MAEKRQLHCWKRVEVGTKLKRIQKTVSRSARQRRGANFLDGVQVKTTHTGTLKELYRQHEEGELKNKSATYRQENACQVCFKSNDRNLRSRLLHPSCASYRTASSNAVVFDPTLGLWH
jgi:hypothetical protein